MDYDKGLHANYDETRRLTPQALDLWVETARRFLPAKKGLKIADIGSGTGRFSGLLAKGLDAEVVGIEPSIKMRETAIGKGSMPGVRYIEGSAEAIPLGDGECDAAWLSMVIHHVGNIGACIAELSRILKPGGIVLIRNSYRGRLNDIPFYDYFPTGLAVDEVRLPDAGELRKMFEREGFRFVTLEGIRQVLANTAKDYLERIRKRAISTFELIPDADFQEGLQKLESDVIAGRVKEPLTEIIDILVFQKPVNQ